MRGVHVRMRGAHRCMTGITCYKTSNAVVVEEICDKGGYKSACKPKMLSARLGIKRQLRLSLASLGSHALIISGIRRCGKSTLLLQLMHVRQKLDENYKVIVTGSNASLLSQELGTKLTGRHITKELFPVSFDEYLTIKQKERSVDSLASYMEIGGFPEYVKTGDTDQITALFEDILIRDITVRFGIKDVKSLQRLALYHSPVQPFDESTAYQSTESVCG